MFTFRILPRQADRSSTRRPRNRRPLVEGLEGRRLLSGFTPTPSIVGSHIGTGVMTPAIVGAHIG